MRAIYSFLRKHIEIVGIVPALLGLLALLRRHIELAAIISAHHFSNLKAH
jgi:hypothetical protein